MRAAKCGRSETEGIEAKRLSSSVVAGMRTVILPILLRKRIDSLGEEEGQVDKEGVTESLLTRWRLPAQRTIN